MGHLGPPSPKQLPVQQAVRAELGRHERGTRPLANLGSYELHGDRGFFGSAAVMAHSVGTGMSAIEGAVNLQKLQQGASDATTNPDPSAMQASLYKMRP